MTAFKVKSTSFETLRRNGDDLRRIVEALVPDQNKDGASKILYDILRNWNLRMKRKDRKFEGEWLFRNHPQWIVEGVAPSQSKSERCLKTLVSRGYLIRREAMLDGKKTLHLAPSQPLEEILKALSEALEGLMGAISVRRFLRPLLDWTKRNNEDPQTLHYHFKKFATDQDFSLTTMEDLLFKTVEDMKGLPLSDKKASKEPTPSTKMPGWDDAPLESPVTNMKDYGGSNSDTSEGLVAPENDKNEGTLYSNKGTSNKGTTSKVTGPSPEIAYDSEGSPLEFYTMHPNEVTASNIKSKKLTLGEEAFDFEKYSGPWSPDVDLIYQFKQGFDQPQDVGMKAYEKKSVHQKVSESNHIELLHVDKSLYSQSYVFTFQKGATILKQSIPHYSIDFGMATKLVFPELQLETNHLYVQGVKINPDMPINLLLKLYFPKV